MTKAAITKNLRFSGFDQKPATLAQLAQAAANRQICEVLREIENVKPMPQEGESSIGMRSKNKLPTPYEIFVTECAQSEYNGQYISEEEFNQTFSAPTTRQEKADELIALLNL